MELNEQKKKHIKIEEPFHILYASAESFKFSAKFSSRATPHSIPECVLKDILKEFMPFISALRGCLMAIELLIFFNHFKTNETKLRQ